MKLHLIWIRGLNASGPYVDHTAGRGRSTWGTPRHLGDASVGDEQRQVNQGRIVDHYSTGEISDTRVPLRAQRDQTLSPHRGGHRRRAQSEVALREEVHQWTG